LSQPRVTVLIAARDAKEFVTVSVRSALAQTYDGVQVLVVDDGSTDGTSEILASLARSDSRVAVVRREGSGGLAAALAEGVQRVETEYIARLDADDVALPNRIALQVSYLEERRNVAVLGTACEAFDATGGSQIWRMPGDPLAVRWRSLLANPFLHPTVMLRRSTLGDDLNYDSTLDVAQDYDLWCRVLRRGAGANLAEPLVRYRLHERTLTQTRREQQLATHDRIALRTMREVMPEIEMDARTISDLRTLLFTDNAPKLDLRSLSATFLDLLETFVQKYGDTPGSSHLLRAESRRLIQVLVRRRAVRTLSAVGARLLRLDPGAPLELVAVAAGLARRPGLRRP